MIALQIQTADGWKAMITPHDEDHCGFSSCQYVCYLDGPADPDPAYHCDLFDARIEQGQRLPACHAAQRRARGESTEAKPTAGDELAAMLPYVSRAAQLRYIDALRLRMGESLAERAPDDVP